MPQPAETTRAEILKRFTPVLAIYFVIMIGVTADLIGVGFALKLTAFSLAIAFLGAMALLKAGLLSGQWWHSTN
jgi:hypothetical protein